MVSLAFGISGSIASEVASSVSRAQSASEVSLSFVVGISGKIAFDINDWSPLLLRTSLHFQSHNSFDNLCYTGRVDNFFSPSP